MACIYAEANAEANAEADPAILNSYSSVPNRRVGRNKRAGGKILKKH